MSKAPLRPVTAAWRPGDPPGYRRFATLFAEEPLRLELGGAIHSVHVAYETWGELNETGSNAVLVEHAFSGDSHAAGPAGEGHSQPGWWEGLIGPGKGIDTREWFVVCPNVLGGCQGTTGPSSRAPDGKPYGSRFPAITIRDQVAVEAAFAEAIGIARWASVVGPSMGAMRVLEWAIMYPDRVASAIVVGCGAEATAEQIALCSLQIAAITSDPGYRNGDYYDAPDGAGPHSGMALARRLGHLSYRSELELATRFGRVAQDGEDPLVGGRYMVESYLDHHGEKLVNRFDAGSYVALSKAMNHHDVGRGRGGMGAALASITADVTVVGVDSDRLYPLRLQREIASLLPARPEVQVVRSLHGHDAFLIEYESMNRIVRSALESAALGTARGTELGAAPGTASREARCSSALVVGDLT